MRHIVRHIYTALTSSIATSSRTSDKVILEVVKMIRREMKEICSMKHNSLLRTSDDSISQFSFDEVRTELMQKIPMLMTIMSGILTKKSINKPLLCLISGMLLKQRLSKMSLMQRVLSVLLYGNGASKQVFYITFNLIIS